MKACIISNGNQRDWDKSGRGVLFYLILMIYISCFLGCGISEDAENSSNNGFGSYAPKLIFPADIPRRNPTTGAKYSTKAATAEGRIDCDASGIAIIRCKIHSAENNVVAEENWQCNRAEGYIKHIPAGRMTVVVEAIAEDGMPLLRGEKKQVDIFPGRQTEGEIILQPANAPNPDPQTDGEILLQPANPPAVSAGSDPKTLVFDWSHIEFPAGVDHYRLEVDPDGDNEAYPFRPVEGAGTIQTTEFTLAVPIHLTDWINTRYRVVALDAVNNIVGISPKTDLLTSSVMPEDLIGHFRGTAPYPTDFFGVSVSVSADGTTLAVGASGEDSDGIGGEENDDMEEAGAVYLFTRSGDSWRQQAYLKASNPDGDFVVLDDYNDVVDYWGGDHFGTSVSVSADGTILAVGANGEAGNGVDGEDSNDMGEAGAAYVFTRSGDSWRQQDYLKASNPGEDDFFGTSVCVSADGTILAVGVIDEAGNGVGGEDNNDMRSAGAVYLY